MTLVPKTYNLLVEAIEDGIAYGWRRAEKHADRTAFDLARENCPADSWFADEEAYRDQVFSAVLNEILEKFHLREEESEG